MVNGKALCRILEMWIGFASPFELGLEVKIRSFADTMLWGAHIVEDSHHTRRTFLLDQLTDDGIVEILNGSPLNAFLDILFLCIRENGQLSIRFALDQISQDPCVTTKSPQMVLKRDDDDDNNDGDDVNEKGNP